MFILIIIMIEKKEKRKAKTKTRKLTVDERNLLNVVILPTLSYPTN